MRAEGSEPPEGAKHLQASAAHPGHLPAAGPQDDEAHHVPAVTEVDHRAPEEEPPGVRLQPELKGEDSEESQIDRQEGLLLP